MAIVSLFTSTLLNYVFNNNYYTRIINVVKCMLSKSNHLLSFMAMGLCVQGTDRTHGTYWQGTMGGWDVKDL